MKHIAGILIFTSLLACKNLPERFAENTVAKQPVEFIETAANQTAPNDVATACLLAQIAYCNDPQEQLDRFLPGWEMAWQPRLVNSNYAFVVTNGRQWAVAFRGSLMEISWHAFDNWINQDLNILTQEKWPYSGEPGAQVSQGIHNSFTNLLQLRDTLTNSSLADFLKSNIKTGTSLLLTGHSLGGSLATVYASYLYQQWQPENRNIEIVSFAAPAPGNNEFVVDFDKKFPRMIRIESQGDIVARFPCTDRVTAFARNCDPLPSAENISVSYQGLSVSLRKALEMSSFAMAVLELKNGGRFRQVAGAGRQIRIEPSSTVTHSVEHWFNAAGYQHGIAQYAAALDVPVVTCP